MSEGDLMRTLAEHRAQISALLEPVMSSLGSENIDISATKMATDDCFYHRVLAADVVAPHDLPLFANSQMDGYAVCAADLVGATAAKPVSLTVTAVIAAGNPMAVLAEETTAAIMTGAPIPRGADAVVPVEQVDPPRFPHRKPGYTVAFSHSVEPGTFVRAAGSDVGRGELLLAAGTRLGPAQYGLLAAAGILRVSVRRRVRVLLVATGQEFISQGESLSSGHIYESNTAALTVALRECGAHVRSMTLSDDPETLPAALAEAVAAEAAEGAVDFVLTMGGISAGAFEVVRQALSPLGLECFSVAMQPGGPQACGVVSLPNAGQAGVSLPVISFPGNPVSALISWEVFLRPVIRKYGGLSTRAVEWLPLALPVDSHPQKHQIRRARVSDTGMVELCGGPGSHLMHSYAQSTALVHLPVGVSQRAAGDLVEVWRIDE